MGDFSTSLTLSALKDLLATPQENEEDTADNNKYSAGPAFATPGGIASSSTGNGTEAQPAMVTRKSAKDKQIRQAQQEKLANSKDIWTEDEVESENHATIDDDDRPEPKYTLHFKQAVTPEDMYLGMSGRNPSSHSCNEIVVVVELPAHDVKHVDLQVKRESMNVLTPTHRLNLTLPHPVDDKNGKAQWIADKQQLRVTLPVKRDYDFLLES
ncbi:hypothetical protein PTSG_02244 [Salpingoeca rosetta]|uniref:PIH1D1/2/3 CS-like domain-containing protein n=1 Tax=Salpingoeca rosetta (strain ATCC 50818 / BSB-021) TaxID=946362 RepID=F2U1M3_SALR5|nr:uncharacterized protein PTSG_02244 [Salpingoeca rosetta]EGD81525.1 hypothetical protein PTSG_02244 [Salpingoeca rosetta]|eukprot:XP_004996729.1 hypothetical protein PTSG_02244 [Salpingoeca rosetta]